MDSDEDTKDGIIVHPDDPVPWFPGQEEDQSLEYDHPDKPARLKRRRRCGQCGPCQIRTNCGECSNCLRRSVLKQSCIYRKCIYLRKPVSGPAKTPPRHRSNGTYPNSRNYPDFMSSSCDDELDSSYELTSPPGIDINGFAVGEASNGDDTEILIEDYTPSPSIIIGGFDDEPQDSQPSSPIRISMNHESGSQFSAMCVEDRIKTPPHPKDCDDASCVNPRQLNALRAIREAESSHVPTGSPDNMCNATSAAEVSDNSCEPYPLNIVPNEMNTVSEQNRVAGDFRKSTENSSSIKSALEKNESVLESGLEHRRTRLIKYNGAICQQLSEKAHVDSNTETHSKPYNQTVSGANSNENIQGSARLPVLQPAHGSQHDLPTHPSSENQPSPHDQNVFHPFYVPKPQSISATYDEAHRQFFSPPNVTVTGHGGFASPNTTQEAPSGSQSHKAPIPPSYAPNEYEQYPRGPLPAWYPSMPIHPHAYPQFGIPRGMYPPHYAYDPMVYPIHPTQNPFHRFGSHPLHPVNLPRMVPPRYYPYRRHPGEHRSNSPASDPDFTKHPDFRKRSGSVSRPNSGNGLSYDPTSAREEIEEYKKHSVFRLRANSLEKPRSPIATEVERRPTLNGEAATSSEVSETGANSEQSSLSNPSVPINRNNALRQLLSHTSTTHVESRANSAVDDDLQTEMRKIGHNSCNVSNIDELRMPSLVRGDALNVESSSPNSSNSSESASTSPLLMDKILKNPLSSVTFSAHAPKSVEIQGNVCIKQDLGDEGIVMLEFQGCKVDLVQCVLDEDILKLSHNPQELKDYIKKSQSTNNTISNPAHNHQVNESVAKASSVSPENFLSCPVEGTSKGVLALANICSSLNREPPQLQKLGKIVAVENSERESHTPPESVNKQKDTEGWKESILKIFSANAEKNHLIPEVESLLMNPCKSYCRSEKWTNFMRSQKSSDTPPPIEEGHENVDKSSENSQISDKNIFDCHVSNSDNHEPEVAAKTLNSDKDPNSLKRVLDETECENSNSKRLKSGIDVPAPNENGNTIVNSLSKFVENTIESYSNEDPPVVVAECDSALMCEEYQTDKVSATLLCDENQKVSSDLQDNEFLTEKTIVELKKKILNRNS